MFKDHWNLLSGLNDQTQIKRVMEFDIRMNLVCVYVYLALNCLSKK